MGLLDFGGRQGSFAATSRLGGDLYVADTYNHQIVRFDLATDGKCDRAWRLNESKALDARDGALYIADSGNHRVLRWRPGMPEAGLLLT